MFVSILGMLMGVGLFCWGVALLSEDEWTHPDYVQARKGRSAVEALIFVLKHCFAFGRLRRRGHPEVEAEWLEKVIAYNFRRMVRVRSARDGPHQQDSWAREGNQHEKQWLRLSTTHLI